MIMVGAGTGLAPFRGFLQERAALRDQGVPIGPSLLFFGCRDHGDRPALRRRAARTSRAAAWSGSRARSRDEPGRPRRYVQDAMLDCADEVWDLLQQDAAVFVCGNAATIAPGVRASLTGSSGTAPAPARPTPPAWLAGLRTADRFVEDIWGG